MRRADRLFRIVEHLRRRARTVTARQLAEALEVSERTIYRDISDLLASGVPITGEAGVGYRLPRGTFDLPPLMFSEEEVEALVLGSRVVIAWGDPELAQAAESALAKVQNVVPARVRARLEQTPLFAVNLTRDASDPHGLLPPLRNAIRLRNKLNFRYADREGRASARTVWPLGLFYWAPRWTLGAYCELREGFRNFRLDRIEALQVLPELYTPTAGRTLADLFAFYQSEVQEAPELPSASDNPERRQQTQPQAESEQTQLSCTLRKKSATSAKR